MVLEKIENAIWKETSREGLSRNGEAALKAIGLTLAMNVGVVVIGFILYWVKISSIAHWLEIDKPTKPYVPGSIAVAEILLLVFLFWYFRAQANEREDNKPAKRPARRRSPKVNTIPPRVD